MSLDKAHIIKNVLKKLSILNFFMSTDFNDGKKQIIYLKMMIFTLANSADAASNLFVSSSCTISVYIYIYIHNNERNKIQKS